LSGNSRLKTAEEGNQKRYSCGQFVKRRIFRKQIKKKLAELLTIKKWKMKVQSRKFWTS
jgi:hypothetical protein